MLPTICPTGNPVSSLFCARLTRRAASAKTMPWSGIGSGSGVSARSHASVHAVRSWRAGLPVIDRERTVSRELAASRFSNAIGFVSASATVSQIEPVHTPCAPSASAAAIWRPRPMPPAASTGTSGPTASTTSGTSTIVEIVAAVATGLGALGDDHVDALRDLPFRVLAVADQSADEDAALVRLLDDVGRRRPERVHDHRRPGATSATSTWPGPSSSTPRPAAFTTPTSRSVGERRHAVLGEQLLDERLVLGRDQLVEVARGSPRRRRPCPRTWRA